MIEFLTEYWFYFACGAVVLWLISPAFVSALVWLRNRTPAVLPVTTEVSTDKVLLGYCCDVRAYFKDAKPAVKAGAYKNISELSSAITLGPDYEPGAPA